MYGPKQVTISQFFENPLNYQQLIRGFYDLNYREFIVLCALNQLGTADTDEIIERTEEGWPKNKINSALKKLNDLDLCTREKVIPEGQGRGYKYIYNSIPATDISNQLIDSFEKFLFAAKQELKDLEYHLKSVDTKAYKRKKTKKQKIREEWFSNED